jgi:hypothetical protein
MITEITLTLEDIFTFANLTKDVKVGNFDFDFIVNQSKLPKEKKKIVYSTKNIDKYGQVNSTSNYIIKSYKLS